MKILLATLSTFGYASSLAEAGRRLQHGGHELQVVTGANSRSLFDGIEVVPAGPSDPETFEVHNWHDPRAVALQFKHVEYALKTFAADLIVTSELTYGVVLAGARHQLPVATVGSLSWHYPTTTGPSGHDALDEARRWHLDESRRIFSEVAKALGVTAPASPLAFLGDRYLIRSTPALHPELADGNAMVRLVGSLMPAVSCRPPKDRPVIVALARTFGAFNPWERIVAGLIHDGWTDIDVLGGRSTLDGPAPTSLPGSVHLVDTLSPDEFFRYDQAVLAGTTWQSIAALRAGLPMTLCPAGAEQPIIGWDLFLRGRAVVVEGRPVAGTDVDQARAVPAMPASAGMAEQFQQDSGVHGIIEGW